MFDLIQFQSIGWLLMLKTCLWKLSFLVLYELTISFHFTKYGKNLTTQNHKTFVGHTLKFHKWFYHNGKIHSFPNLVIPLRALQLCNEGWRNQISNHFWLREGIITSIIKLGGFLGGGYIHLVFLRTMIFISTYLF